MADTPAPYEVDDRGNVAQFYCTSSNDMVGELNREATVGWKPDQSTWDGGPAVTKWAAANGYPEVLTLPSP